jgi:hypothetical protein
MRRTEKRGQNKADLIAVARTANKKRCKLKKKTSMFQKKQSYSKKKTTIIRKHLRNCTIHYKLAIKTNKEITRIGTSSKLPNSTTCRDLARDRL